MKTGKQKGKKPGINRKERGVTMDEEKMISDMRKVLLDYCITGYKSGAGERYF